MRTRIPLPGDFGTAALQGMSAGGNLFSQLMNPILSRERNRQAADLQRERNAQLSEQFQQDLALRKQNASRASSLDSLRKVMMEQQILGLKHRNDPEWKSQQTINLLSKLKEMAGDGNKETTSGEMPSAIPSIGQPEDNSGGIPYGEPQLKSDAVSEFDSHQPKSINGLPLDYIMQGIMAKSLGLPVPKMGSKDPIFHGAARDAYDLEKLKNIVGEDSPVYQNAIETYKNTQTARKDLSNLRGRTLGGLKPGERWISDPETGSPIGKDIPLTPSERTEYKGRGFFNYVFPLVSRGLSDVSGEGSIRKFADAASRYKTDPKSKEFIDNYLLAKKLLTATVVKEAATLASGKQKTTYGQLRDSLDSSDIPNKIASILKQFNLPSSANALADKTFQQVLNTATKAGEQSVPAFQQHYFNPEQHKTQNFAEKQSRNVIVTDPSGKRFETTEENANHLPQGWKRD